MPLPAPAAFAAALLALAMVAASGSALPPPLPLPLPLGDAHVHIAGFQFDPDVLHILVGTEVTWDNHDSAPHTATAYDGSFASPLLRQGQAWTWRFDAEGTFPYYCDPHEWMTGEVVVLGLPLPPIATAS